MGEGETRGGDAGRIRVENGSNMGRKRVEYGSNMGRIWVENGSNMGRKRVCKGRKPRGGSQLASGWRPTTLTPPLALSSYPNPTPSPV